MGSTVLRKSAIDSCVARYRESTGGSERYHALREVRIQRKQTTYILVEQELGVKREKKRKEKSDGGRLLSFKSFFCDILFFPLLA